MTNQEINIAVAECLGWYDIHVNHYPSDGIVHGSDLLVGSTPDKIFRNVRLPSYSSDLNACHAMEKFLLSDNEREIYTDHLIELSKDDVMGSFGATARQRCEAFLKVKGKWQ